VRRPAGVVVAAVFLAIIALFGIFASLFILGVVLLVHTPVIPNLPGVRVALGAVGAFILLYFVFCAWTVVGLIRLRRWARYSILLIGGWQFFLGALLCAGTILVRSFAPPLPPTANPINLHDILIATAGLYALLSLLGAFWLVYFNLGGVRSAFRPAGEKRTRPSVAAPPPPRELPLVSIDTRPPQS
jgi:hypothetical protein